MCRVAAGSLALLIGVHTNVANAPALAPLLARAPDGPYYAVHRFNEAGMAGQPTLGTVDVRWSKTIRSDAYWKRRRKHLWYWVKPDTSDPAFNDLHRMIVFYVDNRYLVNGVPDGDTGYYVVGHGCGVFFMANRILGPLTVAAPADGPGWAAGCYYDPLAPDQRTDQIVPPLPPDAPADV